MVQEYINQMLRLTDNKGDIVNSPPEAAAHHRWKIFENSILVGK